MLCFNNIVSFDIDLLGLETSEYNAIKLCISKFEKEMHDLMYLDADTDDFNSICHILAARVICITRAINKFFEEYGYDLDPEDMEFMDILHEYLRDISYFIKVKLGLNLGKINKVEKMVSLQCVISFAMVFVQYAIECRNKFVVHNDDYECPLGLAEVIIRNCKSIGFESFDIPMQSIYDMIDVISQTKNNIGYDDEEEDY